MTTLCDKDVPSIYPLHILSGTNKSTFVPIPAMVLPHACDMYAVFLRLNLHGENNSSERPLKTSAHSLGVVKKGGKNNLDVIWS